MLCACCAALAVPSNDDEYPEVVKGVDFGGATVQILDWWSPESDQRSEDPTEEEAAQYAYQDWIEETYNVHVQQKQGGDWASNGEKMAEFAANPDDSLRIYIVDSAFVGDVLASGAAAPVSDKYVDLESDKWNSAELDYMTINGEVYGLHAGNSEPRGCLFFNKRVLAEAGIDSETIYDLQAEGKWTWDAFEGMLEQVARDTDNDGEKDIYGLVGTSDELYISSVYANGGTFFDFDDSGKLYPAMDSDETLTALNWSRELKEKYWAPRPEDASWDWYKDTWKEGNCGFYVNQAWAGFNDNSEMSDMEDAWGCVAFPVRNEGDPYVTVVADNIVLIPACYDEETVAKLALVYDLWSNPTPGYADENDWIGNKYAYTDVRAVDETYAMLREGKHGRVNASNYVGTPNDVLGSSLLWALDYATPAELIEAGMPEWQQMADDFNESFSHTELSLYGVRFDTAGAGVGQAVPIVAVTSTKAAKLVMYAENGAAAKTWTSGYTDSGKTRTWNVSYAFGGTGNRTMGFKAFDASGKATDKKTASIQVVAAPTLSSVGFAGSTVPVKKSVGITAVTSTGVTKLVMYNGSSAVKSWTDGYTDSGTTRTWKLAYAFSGAGNRSMTFKGFDASGAATEAKTATVTVTAAPAAPTLNSVHFGGSSAAVKQNVVITAVTSNAVTQLTMYLESGAAVKSWTGGYTDSGNTRTWTVTYAFSGAGTRTMVFRGTGADGTVTEAKTASITITK